MNNLDSFRDRSHLSESVVARILNVPKSGFDARLGQTLGLNDKRPVGGVRPSLG